MSEYANPFAEPEDDDRTVIMPRSAISALAQRANAPAQTAASMPEADFASLAGTGESPVISFAGPLLSLIARLRNTLTVPDPGTLRERTVGEIRSYEAALREERIDPDMIRIAHYVLCASLDDVVQCTPWGSRGPWADLSLTSAFHRDVKGGERFFQILRKLLGSPNAFLPLLELMYLCMSLGMQGQYRLSPRGPAELDQAREETYATIMRLKGSAPRDLSPHWMGLARPFRAPRFETPLWLAGIVGVGLLSVVYAFASFGIGSSSDDLLSAAAHLPPATMATITRAGPETPPPPTPQRPGLRSRLIAALQGDIQQGHLSVEGTESVPIVRLQSQGMFASGQATVLPQYVAVLRRIGDAIGRNEGKTRVEGYTDTQPIHSLVFPSNYDLALARARAAAEILSPYIGGDRVTAIGMGDQSPIGDNSNEQGRRANRRVEITVDGTSGQ
ncbi:MULTISPECIES: type IVB secretion system protein IcmH/DotU [Acetobacter]|uniref:Type IVB secretion system protein IcmH/DotU n=1 Tax=Acetobacter sacchari TaxID=2661687 RepID=A0ABS3LRM9_9PROT|nr:MULTISPECIES: type IVB secretion system protein IcmH/DotU [Acetobacter]MBO1358577.1 type IVB secretion system protein IcmH/DotU [Acetobacter sacchari]OUJ16190.1 hypothetical protein HK28_02945 [Acetobacter sp. DsW_063]